MDLLPGHNKVLPRQGSLPAPNTTACSGWDCLQQSQQFGVIFSIVLSVLTLAFLYWFLFWRRRKLSTEKQQIDDSNILEMELRSPSLWQSTAVIRFASEDRKKNSRGQGLVQLYGQVPQPNKQLPRCPACRDRQSVPAESAVSDSTTTNPQKPERRKQRQSSIKQDSGVPTGIIQSATYNQAIQNTYDRNRYCFFCGQSHAISEQQRMAYINRDTANWYSQQPHLVPGIHAALATTPGIESFQVPLMQGYHYPQPYMATRYAPIPTATLAPFTWASQLPQGARFTQTVHPAQQLPVTRPHKPHFGAGVKTQAPPGKASVPKGTCSRSNHPASNNKNSTPRDIPWWRRWAWRYPTTGRASTVSDSESHRSRIRSPHSSFGRSSENSQSPSRRRPIRRKSRDYSNDVPPALRVRGRSTFSKEDDQNSTKLPQISRSSHLADALPKAFPEQTDDWGQRELIPDFTVSDLGSLPSHTTLDSSDSVHSSCTREIPRDKILEDFEKASLAQSKMSRKDAMEGLQDRAPNSSKNSIGKAYKNRSAKGLQCEPSGKHQVDSIQITVSPPTSSILSARTAASATEFSNESRLRTTFTTTAGLRPKTVNNRAVHRGPRNDAKGIRDDRAAEVTKGTLSFQKEAALGKEAVALAGDCPVRYRVDCDRLRTNPRTVPAQQKSLSGFKPGNFAHDLDAGLERPHRRRANRDRELRNLGVMNQESFPSGSLKDRSDLASFRPSAPRPFTTRTLPADPYQPRAGAELSSHDEILSEDRMSGFDSLEVQPSPQIMDIFEHEIPKSPSHAQGRKNRAEDSSEFFRFRGSDIDVERRN